MNASSCKLFIITGTKNSRASSLFDALKEPLQDAEFRATEATLAPKEIEEALSSGKDFFLKTNVRNLILVREQIQTKFPNVEVFGICIASNSDKESSEKDYSSSCDVVILSDDFTEMLRKLLEFIRNRLIGR